MLRIGLRRPESIVTASQTEVPRIGIRTRGRCPAKSMSLQAVKGVERTTRVEILNF